ncbi:hypothetical protein L9F63_020261, partial [Diploptera punctata]
MVQLCIITLGDSLSCFKTEGNKDWINNKVNCSNADTMCYTILKKGKNLESKRGCIRDENSYKNQVKETKSEWDNILPLKCRRDYCNDQKLEDLEKYYTQCYMCGFEKEDSKSCYKDFDNDYNRGTCPLENWCSFIIGDKGVARRGCTTIGMNFISDEECEKAKEETDLFGNVKCEKCRGNFCNRKPGTALQCYTCDSGFTPACRSDLKKQWMTSICSEEKSYFCFAILTYSYAVRGCAKNESYSNKCNIAKNKLGNDVKCINCNEDLCNSQILKDAQRTGADNDANSGAKLKTC